MENGSDFSQIIKEDKICFGFPVSALSLDVYEVVMILANSKAQIKQANQLPLQSKFSMMRWSRKPCRASRLEGRLRTPCRMQFEIGGRSGRQKAFEPIVLCFLKRSI
jgi:hypothetical protein